MNIYGLKIMLFIVIRPGTLWEEKARFYFLAEV